MARQLRLEYEGAIYHITARGNERKKIYHSQRDYTKFKEYLKLSKKRFGCIVHAYVLMGNHYHLILETPEGNLSKVMHFLNGSYATYVNTKRKRSGHLWQGRFKSILVDRDSYLLELSRYLHLNPVRAGMVDHPAEYLHSSYRYFVSDTSDDVSSPQVILEMLSQEHVAARKKYQDFVEKTIGKELGNPFDAVYAGLVLGHESFVRSTLDRLSNEQLQDEEIPCRRKLQCSISERQVVASVLHHFQLDEEDLPKPSGLSARKWAIYLLKHYVGTTSREAGEVLDGMSCSAVAKSYQRFAKEVESDPDLQKEIENIWLGMSHIQV